MKTLDLLVVGKGTVVFSKTSPMRTMSRILFLLLLWMGCLIAAPELKLQVYEPNLLGYTVDDNDVGYMDFTLSQMYPIGHFGRSKSETTTWRDFPSFYFAFTGRFGQYLLTRESSPVEGKRFNPKLFMRYWLGGDRKYIDFGYGHESNGQSINRRQAFEDLEDEFEAKDEERDFARDSISRGWDYLELDFVGDYRLPFWDWRYEGRVNLKHFLYVGALQGELEEVNGWEDMGDGFERREVDGFTLTASFNTPFEKKDFDGKKFSLAYTTGLKGIFQRHTIKGSFTFKLFRIPLMIWAASGYNSDLVDYYRRTDSVGASFVLLNDLSKI